MKRVCTSLMAVWLAAGCGSGGASTSDAGGGGNPGADAGGSSSGEVSSSEIAVDIVSGAINTTHGSSIAWLPAPPKRGVLARILDEVNPIGTAHADEWTCTGGSLTPKFDGPGSYSWMPPSCSVTIDGQTGSSSWNGAFTLVYGSGCDSAHPWIDHQAATCTLTRTTATGGNTRTIDTLDGTTRTVSHDSNGAGTGWDSGVTPAPSNAGVVVTCGASGCDTSRTIAINGSHLTGMVVRASGTMKFDHTITTGAAGLTVTGSDATRTVSGTVTVQHNLIKNTASVTLTNVTFGDTGCPFPTAGTVSATFTNGPKTGTTETMTFTGQKCGAALLSVGATMGPVDLTAPI